MRNVCGILLLALVGAACGESPPPAPTTVTPRRLPPPVVDAGTTIAAVDAYQYQYVAMGKRDPFRTWQGTTETVAGSTAVEPCDDVLCQFDIDDLKLVAVVSGSANPIAMVEDKSGVGHLVRSNSKIGRQTGKVTAILKDCIVVTSFTPTPDGRSQAIRQNLCVSTEGPGGSPVLDLMNGKTRE